MARSQRAQVSPPETPRLGTAIDKTGEVQSRLSMDRVLLGFRRHMVPIPSHLFRRVVPRAAAKAARVLGDLGPIERRIHHFVVRELPRFARPMPPDHIARALDLPLEQVVTVLDELERRLIFLYRPGGRDVAWAYPITVGATPHRLTSASGERLTAA